MNKTGLRIFMALMLISAVTSPLVAGKGRVHRERKERAMLIDRYRAMRSVELERNLAAGRYADLFSSPAWSIGSLFFDEKNQVTVSGRYSYATDCYGSSGSGSNSNITRLAFGESPIRLQDILLASRLAARDYPAALAAARLIAVGPAPAVMRLTNSVVEIASLATQTAPANNLAAVATAVNAVGIAQNDKFANRNDAAGTAIHDYLTLTAADRLPFIGKAESYGVNVSFARYVVNDNFTVGFDLPVVYKKNTLKANYEFTGTEILQTPRPLAFGGTTDQFLERYGNNPQRFLKDIMQAKGIDELGGSAAGLGDVSLFASGQFHTGQCDKIVTGLRLQLPTGKKQSMRKLWSPDLGNGGFAELSAFGNVFVSYKRCINPHISLSAGCSLPGHVERRVPKRVSVTNGTGNVAMVDTLLAADQRLAFADRISLANGAGVNSFDGFDSLVPNFGDSVSRVKITRGAELKARLGNVIEQFMSRRGFLDMFYDFRAKMKDSATGLAADQYDIESVRRHTNQLEHRLGVDYSYQFDLASRMRLGIVYTVAGRNVAKAFDIAGSMNYAF